MSEDTPVTAPESGGEASPSKTDEITDASEQAAEPPSASPPGQPA